MKLIAEYKCLNCGHEWKETLKGPTECPLCGHLYIRWLNYEKLKKERGWI